MLANPALLASLFITAVTKVTVDATEQAPAHDRVDVTLSDGSTHQFEVFIETGFGPDGAPTYRAGLCVPTPTLANPSTTTLVEGPVVTELHRGMFEAVKVAFPDMTPLVPAPPADPTEEEIAQHAGLVQKGIDAAAAAAAAALASTHPVAAAAIEVADEVLHHIPPQQHFDRLHALLEVVQQHLPNSVSWAVSEIGVIYSALGITKST
jgi:hypothetical protein